MGPSAKVSPNKDFSDLAARILSKNLFLELISLAAVMSIFKALRRPTSAL